MACTKQLCPIILLLLLTIVDGHINENYVEDLKDLMQVCPKSCPYDSDQASSTEAESSWCSTIDFSEPPWETKLPWCKNITVSSSNFSIENDLLTLDTNGIQVSYRQSHYSLAEDGKTAIVCYQLSPQLLNCNLKRLDSRLYAYNESLLALQNCRTNEVIALVDFYRVPGHDYIVGCDQSFGYTVGVFLRCQYITLGPNEYQLLDNETTIRLTSNNRTVYQVTKWSEDPPNIEMCFPLTAEMTNCDRFKLYEHEYEVGANHRVYDKRIKDYLELGEYRIPPETKEVQFCKRQEKYTVDYYVFRYCRMIQLSSAALIILAVVIHLAFPSINYHAKPLICQMVSMAVHYIAEASRTLWYPATPAGCYTVFGFFYFSAMTSFFWLNVLAYDLWSIFANLQTSSMQLCANLCDKKPKFLLYSIYAYCIPLIMTILSLVLETHPSMQEALNLHPAIIASCWFTDATSRYLFYSGPIFYLLCVNMILFGLTVCNLRRASKGVQLVNKKRNRQLFFVCLKVFVIMGLCWSIEFVTFLADGTGVYSYPALISQCIQGYLLFIIYICKPSTMKIILRKVTRTVTRKGKKPPGANSSSGAGNTSSGISMESAIPCENSVSEECTGKKPSEMTVHQTATV